MRDDACEWVVIVMCKVRDELLLLGSLFSVSQPIVA